MIAVDTAAAAIPGATGAANAALNGLLGLFIIVQTVARFVPTLQHSEVNSWFGKILNYIFLYSKTYTKSETTMSLDQPQNDADAIPVDTAADLAPCEATYPEPIQIQSDSDAAMRAITAAADAVVAVSAVVQKRARDETV